MKHTRFQDIPQFTRWGSYHVDVDWSYLERNLSRWDEDYGVELDPDFQRAHVWSETQQIRYIEFCLRGGKSGREIYWNCPTFGGSHETHLIVLVDGKQRLNAVLRFMRNEIPVFGSLRNEYTDSPRLQHGRFSFNVNDLMTRAEVLQWYIDLNDGGVAHTSEEIKKVKALLAKETTTMAGATP